MFPTPIEKTSRATNAGYRVAVPVSLVVWLLPLIAVALTSMRSLTDITQGNYWGVPSDFQLIENYATIFQTTPMGRYILNSVIITLPTVAGAIAISSLAGFALAKFPFRGNLLVFAVFIGGNFIPFQILMIPVRNLEVGLGVFDTHLGLILFHVAFQTGFCMLFLRNFIKALPHELFEAARVEGASEFHIFARIVVPLIRPALAALAVLIFTFVWRAIVKSCVWVCHAAARSWRSPFTNLTPRMISAN